MHRNRWIGGVCALVLGSLGVASCGGDDEGSSKKGTGGSAGSGGNAGDASATGGAAGDASATGGAGGATGGGAGTGGSGGGTTCPPYYALCNGQCTYTGNDPKNCGGCGVACPTGQVCSAGGCATDCMPGLNACNGSCVDVQTSNDHCGTCGNKCAAGTGCVGGACVTALTFTPPAKCGGGPGPVIDVGAGDVKCAGDLGATTFTWAVCSCKDVKLSSKTLVDGFDSTKGPYKPGELGGGVGANNAVIASSEGDIYGQLWAASQPQGISTSSKFAVYNDLQCAGPLKAGEMSESKDAYVAGAITGKFSVGGTLYAPTAPGNGVTYGKLVQGPVTVKPPCECSKKIPVVAIVAAKKTANDNALIGLDAAVLTKPGHPDRIDLPCGHYYLNGFKTSGALTIVAHGHTALYIDGDIAASSLMAMTPEPGGSLDIFVSGTITASSTFKLGSANFPALTRLYIGGSTEFKLTANVVIGGNVWAGNAKVTWTSDTDMFGAVFADDFESTAPLAIHYDRAIVDQGDECKKTPPPDAGTDGGTTTSCGSCKDCGNQACINGTCGQCSSSAQCCPPLQCFNGKCTQVVK